MKHPAVVIWPVLLALVVGCVPVQAQHLVLRDLTLLDNDPVESFDSDGILLASGRTVRWDNVLDGRVAAQQQVRFDDLRKRVGQTAFRLKTRLARSDFDRLQPAVDQLVELATQSGSEGYLMYLARVAQLRYQLGQEDQVARFAALLRLLELRASIRKNSDRITLPQSEVLELDRLGQLHIDADGLVAELLPAWIGDPPAPREAERIGELLESVHGPDGNVYRKMLAIAGGLENIPGPPDSDSAADDSWLPIHAAHSALMADNPQRALEVLETVDNTGAAPQAAIALY